MKLYKFSLRSRKKEVDKEVLEVEEKPKTYITTDNTWKSRINKSGIGKVNSYNVVHLLEDDEKKARELFCKKLRSDICTEKGKIENANTMIAEYENIIKEISWEG